MEIAWIVGGGRPAFDHGTERLGQRGDETTVASADGENVGVRRRAIGFAQGSGQGQPWRAIGRGRDILGEVGGAQAELAVGQRAGRVVGAPHEDADDGGRSEEEKRRQLHGQAKLKRARAKGSHASPSTRRYPTPRTVWISTVAPRSISLRRRWWTWTGMAFDPSSSSMP